MPEADQDETHIRVEIGADEVGLGAVAGPLVAAAVVCPAPPLPFIEGVADSKTLSKKRRIELAEQIRTKALFWVMAASRSVTIDRYGVGSCHMACLRTCAEQALQLWPDAVVIVDGNRIIPGLDPKRQRAEARADAKYRSVGAASIVAKVWRDQIMEYADQVWPGYDFASNSGYPTRAHLAALDLLGPCTLHRKSYAPVKAWIERRK